MGERRAGSRSFGASGEVFAVFLRLGLTSFGGSVAHLGYFRAEFVARRRWLDEQTFADIVALCQFLPGPASSQTGMAIGLLRAGLPGAAAAWLGFTVPSALVMIAFASALGTVQAPGQAGWVHGLKVVALAVVAWAVWGMARTLCPDRLRLTLAVAACGARADVRTAMQGVGAAVVGLLLAALYRPVWTSAIGGPGISGSRSRRSCS